VLIPAGTYGIAQPLIVGSRVHLAGEGARRTVLRSLVRNWGKLHDGTPVFSAIATIGADSVQITDLTVDLSTASTHSNGISLLPAGPDWGGQPPTRSLIASVEVIGGGNYHAYMIWNFRGRDIEIRDNRINGNVLVPDPGAGHEGIESYGGTNVRVLRNVVENIGGAALNFGSAGLPDTGIDGLLVTRNTVRNAAIGLNIGTATDDSGPQNVANVMIADNDFADIQRTGVYVPVASGTSVVNLTIAGNRIRDVGTPETPGRGLHFHGNLDPAVDAPITTSGTVVRGNIVRGVRGANAFGVLVQSYPYLTITDSDIHSTDHSAIFIIDSDSITVEDNDIDGARFHGLFAFGERSRVYVRGNHFRNWDHGGTAVAGVSIHDARGGDIRDNAFTHATGNTSAIRVEASSARVVVFGNRLLSEWQLVTPFVNEGLASNIVDSAPRPGTTELELRSELVGPASGVRVLQTAGSPLTTTWSTALGGIHLSFARPLAGDEYFQVEIDP
jgi:hypothetical protein